MEDKTQLLRHDNFSIEPNCGKSLLFIAVGYSNIEEGQMYFVFQEGIQSLLLVKLNTCKWNCGLQVVREKLIEEIAQAPGLDCDSFHARSMLSLKTTK